MRNGGSIGGRNCNTGKGLLLQRPYEPNDLRIYCIQNNTRPPPENLKSCACRRPPGEISWYWGYSVDLGLRSTPDSIEVLRLRAYVSTLPRTLALVLPDCMFFLFHHFCTRPSNNYKTFSLGSMFRPGSISRQPSHAPCIWLENILRSINATDGATAYRHKPVNHFILHTAQRENINLIHIRPI